MALELGVNAYQDVVGADVYFETRLDVAAWSDAIVSQQEAALVTATQMLDVKDWAGYAADVAQSLAFPRIHSFIDPKLGLLVTLSETEIPDRIKDACCEIAYHLLNNDGLLDAGETLDSIKVGPIELKGLRGAPGIPAIAYAISSPLLANATSGNRWWRAN